MTIVTRSRRICSSIASVGHVCRYVNSFDVLVWIVVPFQESRFTIKEEFGFTTSEMKSILLNKPRVWTLSRSALQERLHFLHNSMGLSHKLIAANPNVITYRAWRVRQRHLMLSLLGRNQYDSRLAGFVSLDGLVGNTDEQFCKDVAKVPLATYHEFLKTL